MKDKIFGRTNNVIRQWGWLVSKNRKKKYLLWGMVFVMAFSVAFLMGRQNMKVRRSEAWQGQYTAMLAVMNEAGKAINSFNMDVELGDEPVMVTNVQKLRLHIDDPAGATVLLNAERGSSNRLVGGADNIEPTTGIYSSPTPLQMNTWGYALPGRGGFDEMSKYRNKDLDAKFARVMNLGQAGNSLGNFTASVDDANAVTVPIVYGALVNGSVNGGTYGTNIIYTIISLSSPNNELVDGTLMQDLNEYECYEAEVGKTVRLKDGRDGGDYNVVAMPDGKCWMKDDLSLKLVEGVALNSTTTDIVGTWMPDRSSQESQLVVWKQHRERPKPEEVYTARSIHVPGHSYYNYYVATAGSMKEAMYRKYRRPRGSICPKGWTLPTKEDFQNLEQKAIAELGSNNYKSFLMTNLPIEKRYYNSSVGKIYEGDEAGLWVRDMKNWHRSYSVRYANYTANSILWFSDAFVPRRDVTNGYGVRCVTTSVGAEGRDNLVGNYLQEMDSETCYGLNASPMFRFTLKDKRDENEYRMMKSLRSDGLCWMYDGLRLRLKNGQKLTSDLSAVWKDWDPGHNTGDGTNLQWNNGGGFVARSEKPETEQFANSGVYYNFNAATAGSEATMGNAKEASICPKGWRLPTKEEALKYWRKGAYGNKQDDSKLLTGKYSKLGGGVTGFGQKGFLWTQNARDAGTQNVDVLQVLQDAGAMSIVKADVLDGMNVRCVISTEPAKMRASNTSTLSDFQVMQDLGPGVCERTPQGTAVTLMDVRDGNKYKVVKALDGKCWMTQPLRLVLRAGEKLDSKTTDTLEYTPNRSTRAEGDLGHSYVANEYESGHSSWDAIKDYAQDESYQMSGYVLYNFRAATAAGHEVKKWSEEPEMGIGSSICPRGWRLPIRSWNYNEIEKLLEKYGKNVNGELDNDTMGFKNIYSNLVREDKNSPMHLSTTNSYGHYWTQSSERMMVPISEDEFGQPTDDGLAWSSGYYFLAEPGGEMAHPNSTTDLGNKVDAKLVQCVLY